MALTRTHRGLWSAAGFLSNAAAVNSLGRVNIGGALTVAGSNTATGLQTFANITVNSITGAAGWRGIGTISSGTAISCIAATAAVSGAVIQITPYMAANLTSSGQSIVIGVTSVSAGAFVVVTGGNVNPSANVPFAWTIVR